ncbi:Protein disulfide isomerase7 precursor [Monocercomonoides exilis]|uniref:Protein disulfide isomerase7 precursor n=1 Tax=Monocercomonoides exilis TaxID=2049356 RepID=UPI00355A9ABA|nr:Protein disulfide isomerase7 precursor [Monocercomonoides exilis]|eukprot:MONOS_4634.1-p1 / transcript=MONOS_4634.1 / gene=MONOS_4634 / organism=Monocercomonoides_exilis_PA203 / gene_product=Protein disulfide isomerase7 precursor / transcript_product=Protein disulfide isomerase7 precursor / location=Mono_scaffold00125:64842-66324(-) / protein_length=477 / sequence_SO=supercontig / SO=protein_coding / is_pseudo=false
MLNLFICVFNIYLTCFCEVVQLTEQTYGEFLKNNNAFVRYISTGCGHCTRSGPPFQKLAYNFANCSERISFAEVDCVSHQSVCKSAQISSYPTYVLHRKLTSDVDIYEGDRSVKHMTKWLKKKIGYFVYETKANITELNCSTFNKIVMDPSENVFVTFVSDWCHYCKEFLPILSETSKLFYPEDHVRFAIINAEKNAKCLYSYNIQSYPQMKFFPAYSLNETDQRKFDSNEMKGTNKIVNFKGERSVEYLTEWINKQTGTTFRSPDGVWEDSGIVDHSIANAITNVIHSKIGKPISKLKCEKVQKEVIADDDDDEEDEEAENNADASEHLHTGTENNKTLQKSAKTEINEDNQQVDESKKEGKMKKERKVLKEILVPHVESFDPPPFEQSLKEANHLIETKIRNSPVKEHLLRYLNLFLSGERDLDWFAKERMRLELTLKSDGGRRAADDLKLSLIIRKNLISLFRERTVHSWDHC